MQRNALTPLSQVWCMPCTDMRPPTIKQSLTLPLIRVYAVGDDMTLLFLLWPRTVFWETITGTWRLIEESPEYRNIYHRALLHKISKSDIGVCQYLITNLFSAYQWAQYSFYRHAIFVEHSPNFHTFPEISEQSRSEKVDSQWLILFGAIVGHGLSVYYTEAYIVLQS